jgi:hypothetical protein
MSRELNKIFDVQSRQARKDILDKFDLTKDDKNKVLNKIDGGASGSGSGSGKKLDCLAVLSIITKNNNDVVKINLNSKEILYNDTPFDAVLKKIDYEQDGADNVYMISIGELGSRDLKEIVCTSFGWVDDYSGISSPGLILGDTYVTPSESADSIGGETQIWKDPRYYYFVWHDYDGYTDTEEYNILYILNDPTNVPV